VPERGLVYCWGANWEGSLGVEAAGDPRQDYLSEPTRIALTDGSLRFKSVSAGDGHACALTDAGDLYCWGRNSQGQIGNGLSLDDSLNWRQRSPTRVGSDTWLAVSAGLKVTCGVQSDQRLYCWGGIESTEGTTINEGARNGEVGNGSLSGAEPVPAEIGSGSIGGATRSWRTVVTSIRTHECALTAEDEVYCWGLGEDGQLGDGHIEPGYSNPIPTRVESDDGVNDQWEQIGTGGAYTCALRKDHSLWCWGKNEFGALGVGTGTTQLSKPTRVILPEPVAL
jgi:alpha-tubulin suppressor-like RCC1 family protein